MRTLGIPAALLGLAVGGPPGPTSAAAAGPAASPASGAALYRAHCAACHGTQGTPPAQAAFEVPLPDFRDCDFAAREPDADWLAVVHRGGPARGFSAQMPPFGAALSDEEIEAVLAHVRSFCSDDAWPRGELNLPRPLVTTKAYPEDELVWTTTGAVEGPGAVVQEIEYEQRIGPRSQIEISVPWGWREQADDHWDAALGDVSVGARHAFHHDFERGTIWSVGGEVRLPTGDEDEGFGGPTGAFEAYLAWGRILPAGFFLHAQGGAEVPFEGDEAEEEAFWRLAVGRSFTSGRFGRVWSPMVELLGSRTLASGAHTQWDLVPQVQVTLNRRQHVSLNAGVRLPLSQTATRDSEVLVYVLWDWFDGGLLEGW